MYIYNKGSGVQELEGERDKLEEALCCERDKRDQQNMDLRKEVAAVQMAADDDKHRTCAPRHMRRLYYQIFSMPSLEFDPNKCTLI